MLSYKSRQTAGVTYAVAVAFVLAFAVGGCQVRPLYGSAPMAEDGSVKEALDTVQIAIPEAGRGASDRTRQVVYNAMIFGFHSGDGAAAARYRLDTNLAQTNSAVGLQRLSDIPAAYTLTLDALYVLADANTGETLTTGKADAALGVPPPAK